MDHADPLRQPRFPPNRRLLAERPLPRFPFPLSPAEVRLRRPLHFYQHLDNYDSYVLPSLSCIKVPKPGIS